jgi:Domain of unknown function (DUF4436)
MTDAELRLTAFANTNDTKTRCEVALTGALQGFNIAFTAVESQNSDGAFVLATVTFNLTKISARRSATTIFFSIFIVVCMWLLSMTAFILAFTLWFRHRKVEPPTIGFVASLLFALPAIRNTQPGVPGIGCTIDVSGFLWNMFLVLVASLLLMWNYIIKYTKEKAPTKSYSNPNMSKDFDTSHIQSVVLHE